MLVFDFIKKFFGWADESSKKRRASDSPSSHEEFLQIKRLRYDYDMGHRRPTSFDDSRYGLEEDERIKISTDSTCQTAYMKKLPNGVNNEKSRGFLCAKSTPAKSSHKKCTGTSRSKHSECSVERYTDNGNSGSCIFTDSNSSTLAKTHRLREKKQYSEMLQNYVPQRIQKLCSKSNEPKTGKRVTEVIDLEKSDGSKPGPALGSSAMPPFYSSDSQWLSRNKSHERRSAQETIIDEKDDKKDKRFFQQNETDREEANSSSSCSSKTTRQSLISDRPASNSLKDRLASKAVMKNDFIPEVVKRYNARIEERNKEAEELKKMTKLLAKQNRLAREAALEEQLARSMRLCEAVLDDRKEPEEAPLPTLTPAMLQEVRQALVPHPPNQVLAEGFGLQITRKDIHTLAGLNWLNDEVINFYMNLLIVRGTGGNFPQVHVMNTFFYPKLLSGGHASLKRWTRKVDIFSKDLLVVPIHLGVHWCMSVVDFREKTIRYFDSMGGSNPKCLNALKQYLQDESLDKKKKPYDVSDWKLESVKDIPQQMNGSDCGVFSCMFAEYICGNKRLTFTQKDMPYFRNKMVYEILHSKLL